MFWIRSELLNNDFTVKLKTTKIPVYEKQSPYKTETYRKRHLMSVDEYYTNNVLNTNTHSNRGKHMYVLYMFATFIATEYSCAYT